MHILYNLIIAITSTALGIIALFNKKMKLFVHGRKNVIPYLKAHITPQDKTLWIHCASLGEFEQGVPIMEAFVKSKPEHKLVVSFFSPSGYEIKKNTPLADVVVYLPLDTPSNARQFVSAIHPELVLFVKYEFWPNYLFELQKNNIPVLLVSGVFRADQVFFKSYGGFMRKALGTFEHFFVQDQNSLTLLTDIGLHNVTLSGDTRFDRVSNQLMMDNQLPFASKFKGDSLCIVCGSTWPEDEDVLIDYINVAPRNVKFIIAPHKIETEKIESFSKRMKGKSMLHSRMNEAEIADFQVLIIDCIGLLSKLYAYADIAYVGGAMGKTGLHNILEPATFGVPIIIGNNFEGFPEAKQLLDLGGLFVVHNATETKNILSKLVENPTFRIKSGAIAGNYIRINTGATEKIMEYISARNL